MNSPRILDDIASPKTASDVLAAYRTVCATDQLTDNERDGYMTGFLMGLTYALAAHREDRMKEAARTLISLYAEYEKSNQ